MQHDSMRILSIRVKPNAKQQTIRAEADGSWTVQPRSPPVDGQANAELIKLLAKTFDVPKSAIRIKSGAAAKLKLIEIEDES